MFSRVRLAVLLGLMVGGHASHLAAQTDPRTLPLVPPAAFSALAVSEFYYDYPDGAGGTLSYGGGAMGVSEDGNYLYVSCLTDDHGIAKLRIPADGGVATVVSPCLGPDATELHKVHPDPTAYKPQIGGVLEQGGRMVVTGYITYDANGGTTASHWSGTSLARLSGPFGGSVAPGLVKSQMGSIPQEWRAALGGPAFSTAGYSSIISRASYGAAFSVFDPATVNRNGFPMQMLLGCPHSVASCQTYGTPTSNNYNGSELSGGAFIVPGTRTFVAIERESTGPTCYGYTTRNPAEHGLPYLDAVYCYSLSDPLNQKGPKGYPYRLVAKLYDLSEFVDVRLGTKQPWNIKQYATVDLPGSGPGEFITAGAFNPVRGEYYLLRLAAGNLVTVSVYRFGSGTGNGGSPTVPSAPANLTSTVNGSTLALSWSGSSGALQYYAEVGTAPGASNIAVAVPLGAVTSIVAPGLANGSYYVRLRAVGTGGVSVPSNEVFFTVGSNGSAAPSLPGAPDGFNAVSPSAGLVSLSWHAPEGSIVTGYVLEAGSAPGLSNIVAGATLPDITALVVPGVPSGVYYVRLRAKNDAGVGNAGYEARVVVR